MSETRVKGKAAASLLAREGASLATVNVDDKVAGGRAGTADSMCF
jgi:hypothetical protein